MTRHPSVRQRLVKEYAEALAAVQVMYRDLAARHGITDTTPDHAIPAEVWSAYDEIERTLETPINRNRVRDLGPDQDAIGPLVRALVRLAT